MVFIKFMDYRWWNDNNISTKHCIQIFDENFVNVTENQDILFIE